MAHVALFLHVLRFTRHDLWPTDATLDIIRPSPAGGWIDKRVCGTQVSSLRRASPLEPLRQLQGLVFHTGELGLIDYNGGWYIYSPLLNIVPHD
jgi:hypothetical protein